MGKILKQIPNMITSMNLISGIYAIYFSFQGDYQKTLLFVFLAMVFDALDGRAARLLKVDGDFGKEYDSLADVVTFGVAPMMLMVNSYDLNPKDWEFILLLVFPVAGALRLARFNTETYKAKKHFVGIPITLAGFLMTVLVVESAGKYEALNLAITVILAFLMISNIKVPNFKQLKFNKKVYIYVCIIIMVIYALYIATLKNEHMLSIIPIVLVIAYPVNKIIKKRKQKKAGTNNVGKNKENNREIDER